MFLKKTKNVSKKNNQLKKEMKFAKGNKYFFLTNAKGNKWNLFQKNEICFKCIIRETHFGHLHNEKQF